MVDGINALTNILGQINTKPVSNSDVKNSPGSIMSGQKGIQNDTFEEVISNSKLDDRIPNKATLAKMGFNVPFGGGKVGDLEIKPSEYLLDMNGGKTYQNKDGDTIRISNFEGELALNSPGSTSVEYKAKDGSLSHQVYYDPDGNPVKGSLTVKNADGSIVNYKYEYDIDGNKKLISTHVEYANDLQQIKKTNAQSSKQVSDVDISAALNQPTGHKAVNLLLAKSPLGKSLNQGNDLLKMGYLPEYRTDEHGAGFYVGSGGQIRICEQEGKEATGEDGSVRAQYKTKNYEQDIIYDKNGNIKKGAITIYDDAGNVTQRYDFMYGDDGKMVVIR